MKEPLYQWDCRHAALLTTFFQRLKESEVPYFVLRNYKSLPQSNPSKDVDLIIKPGLYRTCLRLLLEVFREHGVSHYYVVHFERAHCILGMNADSDFAIHIDLIEGYANKGYEILSFDYMYSHTLPYQNFRVLNKPLDAAMLIFYKLIGCKQLKQAYRDAITEAYTCEPQKLECELSGVLGRELARRICYFISHNDFDALVQHAEQIARMAKRRVCFRRPIHTLIGISRFFMEKAWRMIWCPLCIQKTIAIEAPDGTGKTTFINHLSTAIAHYFVSELSRAHIYHFRPSFLPNLGAAGEKAGIMVQDKNFTVPHRAKPVGGISSFVRMVYYWLDYLLGMPLIVRRDARFDNFTIFDRYIYDFLVDPHRSRIQLPRWIRSMFAALVKKPRLVFVLDADADVIYTRKQELEPAEIQRQLVEFRKLRHMGDFVHVLDANQLPDDIARQAVGIVIDEFCKKIS